MVSLRKGAELVFSAPGARRVHGAGATADDDCHEWDAVDLALPASAGAGPKSAQTLVCRGFRYSTFGPFPGFAVGGMLSLSRLRGRAVRLSVS
jgi:hypothetical protein